MLEANDGVLYRLVIGGKPELAAVHHMTGDLDDIIWARKDETPIDTWLKYYRPPLDRDGFKSETEYLTRHYADAETLDDFLATNTISKPIDPSIGLTLVNTSEFRSHQDACSSIKECTGWWRFTGIGYNLRHTQAVLHTDYEHPKYGLMGMGHFVLLEKTDDQWSIVAKNMTWIS